MMKKIINVVLSGGSGTRLWPLSRQKKPKQFLKIFDNRSLFQHTINRNKEIVTDFLLITNSSQLKIAKEQVLETQSKISAEIIEPVGRNTAPAIAIGAFSLSQEDIMLVTPSDHMIGDLDDYKKSIQEAITLAEEGYLVTFGIKPTEPNTGFGYIEHNGDHVLSFREKPNLNLAKSFLEKGNFSWNSGMFCFKASVFLEELKKYNSNMFSACKDAYDSMNSEGEIPLELMLKIPSDSIDYAVLEKSDKIKTVSSDFYWTDLGTFDSIIDFFDNGNYVNGINKVDNSNNYIFSSGKQFFTSMKGLVVIDTEDSLVVLERNKTNEIKKIYKSVDLETPELK